MLASRGMGPNAINRHPCVIYPDMSCRMQITLKTQFYDLYQYLDKLNDRYCVIRQFYSIGYGFEGDYATFCPRFVGYCMGKVYINKFKQDYIYSYEGFDL